MHVDIEARRALIDSISVARECAGRLEAGRLEARATALRTALEAGKLRVAVLGEVGNGKSTVLNALIGKAIAPMGMGPATRTPLRLSQGTAPRARLCFADGVELEIQPEDLPELDSDAASRLTEADVELDHPLLAGARWVDLPGLGDVRDVAPETIDHFVSEADAVLFVLNADRLLSMTEMAFLRERLPGQGVDRVGFVLNRMDGKKETDSEALMDRARHLLDEAGLTGAPVVPYSALTALKAQLRPAKKSQEARETGADPVRALADGWLEERGAVLNGSIRRKLEQLSRDILQQAAAADEAARLQSERAAQQRDEAERLRDAMIEERDAMVRRATGGLARIQEQFSVALHDFALQLRESVPQELQLVPVDEARRFLPFYLQDSLRRLVEENRETLEAAIKEVLEVLPAAPEPPEERAAFQLDVEPPVIPLYVPRERAPLSQGSSFVTIAGVVLAVSSDFYGGAILGLGGILSREIGKALEAADRRANLATSAQSLVHGAVEAMESGLKEQFEGMAAEAQSAIEESFVAELAELEEALSAAVERTGQSHEVATEAALRAEEVRDRLRQLEKSGESSVVAITAGASPRQSGQTNGAAAPAGSANGATRRPTSGSRRTAANANGDNSPTVQEAAPSSRQSPGSAGSGEAAMAAPGTAAEHHGADEGGEG